MDQVNTNLPALFRLRQLVVLLSGYQRHVLSRVFSTLAILNQQWTLTQLDSKSGIQLLKNVSPEYKRPPNQGAKL